MEKEEQKRQYLYMEVIRIFACFFVIFTHTKGHELLQQCSLGSVRYWVYLIISIFYKMEIPLFFAVSGALLLSKNEEIGRIWKHRILRIVFSLFAFSLFYYFCAVKAGTEVISFGTFFSRFIGEGWSIPFWYLYAYISYLICLPFLRRMVQNLTNKAFYYLSVLIAIFLVIVPLFQDFMWSDQSGLNSYLNIRWITELAVLYPCMGYFIHHRMERNTTRKVLFPLWIVCLAVMVLSFFLTRREADLGTIVSLDQNKCSEYIVLYCFTFYLTVKYLIEGIQCRLSQSGHKKKVLPYLKRMITSLGGCTFGIYLWHIFFIDKFSLMKRIRDLFYARTEWMDEMVSALVWCACIMLAGYLVTWVMKKIPGLKKLV